MHATGAKKARVSLTMHLPEGHMRMRNIKFMVLKKQSPKYFPSSPTLITVGFDLEAHLARIGNKNHDQEFYDIGSKHTTYDEENLGTPQGNIAKRMRNSKEFDASLQYLNHAVGEHLCRVFKFISSIKCVNKQFGSIATVSLSLFHILFPTQG